MRIGMMSFAHLHAESYIGNLRAVPDVELIGIADDEADRAAHYAGAFSAPLFPSYQALLAEKPDGVVICSENSRHRELVEMAVAAGVRTILCEKPLATTLDDARAIVELARNSGTRVMTAFPVRFSAPIREARTMIQAGKLGQIYGCNATNQGENPSVHRSWFVDPRLAGGGAVMDHTVHVVDMLRWVFDAEITEIYAEVGDLFPAPGTAVDTAGVLMISWSNGAFVGLDCSWSKPNYYPTWGNVKIEFVGERGLVAVDVFGQRFTGYQHANRRPLWTYWGSNIDQGLINEFCASIREDRPPAVSAYDGLKALEAVVAAYLSGQTHQPVKLSEV